MSGNYSDEEMRSLEIINSAVFQLIMSENIRIHDNSRESEESEKLISQIVKIASEMQLIHKGDFDVLNHAVKELNRGITVNRGEYLRDLLSTNMADQTTGDSLIPRLQPPEEFIREHFEKNSIIKIVWLDLKKDKLLIFL